MAWILVLAAALPALSAPEESAGEGAGRPGFASILVVDLEGEVDPIMKAYLERRLDRAKDEGFECVVLRIDSFGGHLFAGKEIADALLEMPDDVRVIAWVPNKAISAAAFIALACDELRMAPNATLGDCQPITMAPGAAGYEEAGEKIQSPLRAWFRRCAEANGHPVLLAEAMVSKHLEIVRVRYEKDGSTHYVEGPDLRAAKDSDVLLPETLPGVPRSALIQVGGPIVREDELLTVTAEEARELGFIRLHKGESAPKDEQALLASLKAPNSRIEFTEPTLSERAGGFLYGLTGVLSALVALSILVFVWQGPGLLTIVGATALGLLLLISATADHLHGLPLFLMGVGVLLLLAEVFVLPGFGIAGILGMLCLVSGLLFLATGASPTNPTPLPAGALVSFGLQFVATVLLGFGGLLLLTRTLPRFGPTRALILTAPSRSGPPAKGALADAALAVGSRGQALTPLRPAGIAAFGSATEDVTSEGEWIESGTPVVVVAVEGQRLTVRAVDAEPSA